MLLAAAVAVITGCGSEIKPAFGGQTREVVDDLGRKVRLPLRIERAVSLAPNLTENIFAVGGGDRLVGVTTYCDYPKEALSIEKVGDTQTPNTERIITLAPDVVFVSTASQLEAFTKTLAERNIAVFVTNPTSIDGVFKNLLQLGDLFGSRDKAKILIDELKRRAKAAEKLNFGKPPVRTFVQISREPLYTIGKDSFLTEIIGRAGGDVVTKEVETAFPVLSMETAAALSPDAIILSNSADNPEPSEVFKNSPAVKNGKIFRIDPDILSRPGPRLIDAMEEIAANLSR